MEAGSNKWIYAVDYKMSFHGRRILYKDLKSFKLETVLLQDCFPPFHFVNRIDSLQLPRPLLVIDQSRTLLILSWEIMQKLWEVVNYYVILKGELSSCY